MIIEMAASAIISIRSTPTHGASDHIVCGRSRAEEGRRHLQNYYAFGMAGKGILSPFSRL